MSDSPAGLAHNRLLAELPADALERLGPDLRLIRCQRDIVLSDIGERPRHLYFPSSAAIGHEVILADGTLDEIETIGPEGAVGLAMVLGGEPPSGRNIVRVTGSAYRLAQPAVMREFRRGGALQALLLRYAQRRLMELARAAVCDRRHSTEQRVSRWLLLGTERLRTSELATTHESVSLSLGLRREAVSKAVAGLQRAGIVRCLRGRIAVLDRAGLEARSCECYEALRDLLDVPPQAPSVPAVRPSLAPASPSAAVASVGAF